MKPKTSWKKAIICIIKHDESYPKVNPEKAFVFLIKIKDRASGLTLREGSKRLPENQRNIIHSKIT